MEAFTDRWVDSFAKLYDERPLGEISWMTGTVSPPLIELVVSATLAPGSVVADLGCGAGVHSTFLARQGYDVIGVDRSPRALEAAAQLATFYGLTVRWVEADILDTTLDSESVDVVHDSFVFHNVRPEARIAYVTEAARILRPGGLMVLVGFSDRMTPGSGPIRLTSGDVLGSFMYLFEVEEFRRFRNLPTPVRPDQWHWFGLFRKR